MTKKEEHDHEYEYLFLLQDFIEYGRLMQDSYELFTLKNNLLIH